MSDNNNQNESHPPEVSFEHALERLGEVVRDLEEGKLTLDESLACYEEGMQLLNQCQQMLSTAERKIEVLRGIDAAGNPIVDLLADDVMTLEEKADSRSQRRTARSDVPNNVVEHDDPHAKGPEPNDVDFRDTLF